MTELTLILGTLLPFVMPSGLPHRAPAGVAPPSARPGAERPGAPVAVDLDDPCEGTGVINDIESPHDTALHTCTCTPVTGLRGEVVRMSVSCY